MARMIPSTLTSDTVSPGEIEVFHALKDATETKEWVVLHSLDIAKHVSQVSGEADFIILVPGLGALCLEVKACKSLSREGGAWYYGMNPAPDYRGPFKQSEGVKHSILEHLRKNMGPNIKVPFISAVAFTHITFQENPFEWHAWQVIDKAKIDRDGLILSIVNTLKSGRKHLENTEAGAWLKKEKNEPLLSSINKIVDVLRPEFEYFESPASRKNRNYQEIKKYTEEQFGALDCAEFNERIAYNGPAGAGKTFLAIEMARRASEAGKSVLFLCYNEMLGKHLKEDIKPLSDKIQCGTISGFMLKESGLSPQKGDTFWDDELPKAAKKALINKGPRFDTLIIDEAQDFMSLDFIDLLDGAIKGGLSAGNLMMFGDFNGQAVQKSELTLKEFKEGWVYDLVQYPLERNCRNTPRIGCLAGGFTRGLIKYKGFLRSDDGVAPETYTYKNPKEQTDLLLKTLSHYKSEGIGLGETAVLSCKSNGSAAQELITMFSNTTAEDLTDGELENGLICTTIRRFKGLERYGIIITDIDDSTQNSLDELLYIASTRALGRLTLLLHEQVINELMFEDYSDAA